MDTIVVAITFLSTESVSSPLWVTADENRRERRSVQPKSGVEVGLGEWEDGSDADGSDWISMALGAVDVAIQ